MRKYGHTDANGGVGWACGSRTNTLNGWFLISTTSPCSEDDGGGGDGSC